MTDAKPDTVGFYDRNAPAFAAQTAQLDMSILYERFLKHVRTGGRVLDAGCGVGRDALAFAERGYSVLAFDASEEMVRLSKERLGGLAEILHMRFEDVAWKGKFDGVWACASLLHVASADFPRVARLLLAALRPKGAMYMSFKLGEEERRQGQRLFVDHTVETLARALRGLPTIIADSWVTSDMRAGRNSELWLNAVVTPCVHIYDGER